MYVKALILALLICVPFNSDSQSVLEIDNFGNVNESVENHIEVLTDTTNSLSINQVTSSSYSNQFISLPDFTDELSNLNTYWLRVQIDIQNVDLLPAGIKVHLRNHFVDVYTFSGSNSKTIRTGFFVNGALNEEIIPNSNLIAVTASGKSEIYIKIKNAFDELPVFRLEFVDLRDEIKSNNHLIIFDAFLLGMMCLMIFYGAFLFFQNRDKLYLNYVLYIVFLAIWYIVCFEFGYRLIPNLPRSIFPYSDIPSLIAFIFYIQFVREFVNTKQFFPKWDRFFPALRYAILVTCVVVPAFMVFTELITVGYLLLAIFALLVFVFAIFFIIKLFRSNVQFSNVLALGTSFLVGGTMIFLIHSFFTTDYLYISQKLGTLLELVVFTYGVSLRYRFIENEKRLYQEKLIHQMQENSGLLEKVNRELEEKVKERTIEISEKNEQLTQRNEEIAAQRDLVTEQHNSITESIRYAKTIQSALLPPEAYVNELLKENFILFKPRDIVSGDFYWIKQVKEYIFVVAADCTGHGVPGALMSMLGISFLNEIVHRKDIDQAGDVLNELRKQVKYSLRQTGKEGEARDGMDLALAAINIKTNTLQFSGAYNPVYIIRNNEMIRIKADKMPIGIHPNERPTFTNHELNLQTGDNIYLFSDGFSDQLGRKTGKKFMSKNFRELLMSINQESMHRQKEILDETVEDWKGGDDQTDDILVIGIRV